MAVQVQHFAVTIPAGTAIATPQTTNLEVGIWVVDEIDVDVPPGCNGVVGFQLAMGGQQVIPYNVGTWGVFNDRHLTYPLTDAPTSGAWQLIGYNLGNFPHTLQVTFYLDLTEIPAPAYTPVSALGGS